MPFCTRSCATYTRGFLSALTHFCLPSCSLPSTKVATHLALARTYQILYATPHTVTPLPLLYSRNQRTFGCTRTRTTFELHYTAPFSTSFRRARARGRVQPATIMGGRACRISFLHSVVRLTSTTLYSPHFAGAFGASAQRHWRVTRRRSAAGFENGLGVVVYGGTTLVAYAVDSTGPFRVVRVWFAVTTHGRTYCSARTTFTPTALPRISIPNSNTTIQRRTLCPPTPTC